MFPARGAGAGHGHLCFCDAWGSPPSTIDASAADPGEAEFYGCDDFESVLSANDEPVVGPLLPSEELDLEVPAGEASGQTDAGGDEMDPEVVGHDENTCEVSRCSRGAR